ncbi:MAG: hypothetical protein ACK5LC_01875 [Coprobacillaceae bacterium]
MDVKKAIIEGRELSLYEDSEQADTKEETLDALWQSIYDVTNLATNQILEGVESWEIEEAITWLKKYQAITVAYKEFIVE